MINIRLLKRDDIVRIRTQSNLRVREVKQMFQGSEVKMRVYELVLCSLISDKEYCIWYYEDGHAMEPYNYCKDIISFERKINDE